MKNGLSPMSTAEPSGLLTTTLWRFVASWLSKTSVNGVSAFVVTAGVSNAVALVAVIVTTGAFGLIEDDGAGPPPDAVQLSGTLVAAGSGLNVGSRQPLNVWTVPSGFRTGSFSSGSRLVNSS